MKRMVIMVAAAAGMVAWAVSPAMGAGGPSAIAAVGVDRDNGSNFNDGEQYNNRGNCPNVRGAKGNYAECYYGDFLVGTDAREPGTLREWLPPNYPEETCTVTFYFTPTDAWKNVYPDDPDCQLWTLNLQTDWAEGDATDNYAQWDWTDPTENPAATHYYAQTYEDPAYPGWPDPARSIKWTDENGTAYNSYYPNDGLHKIRNSTDVYVDPRSEYNTYVGVELDYDQFEDPANPTKLVNDVLYNEYNRGLAFKGYTWDVSLMNTNDADVGKPYMEIVFYSHQGDTNRDGKVNYIDLGILATNYDQTGKGWSDGDFTGEGLVDYVDLGILATEYDWQTVGWGAKAVPAPAPLLLLVLGGAAALRRRKR